MFKGMLASTINVTND